MQYDISSAQKANLETAKISWQVLQRQFAQGVLIVVEPPVDLVTIAGHFIDDAKDEIAALMASKLVRKADMADAEKWQAADDALWAVVVAPWVLVQEIVSPDIS